MMEKKKLLNILYVVIIVASLSCMIYTVFVMTKLYHRHDGRMRDDKEEEYQARNDPKTTLEFLTPVKYDFKKVKGDTILSNNFILKNTGDKPLIIYSVEPNCLCSSFSLSKKVILPQDTASIIIRMDTKRKENFQLINTVVKANTEKRMYKLVFMGSVER